GEKRGTPAERAPTQFHSMRPADGLGHGALRRSVAWRNRVAPGPDRRNGDRRRQDTGGHLAALPERAHRARRAPGDGERLPGAARRRMDGATLYLPRANGWLHSTRPGTGRPSRTVRDGHHLRDE